jgi:ParB family chromosome partitioning protein
MINMEFMQTRLLDPKKVHPSRWANRHETSFANDAFKKLKDEIASAGGNVQPIKVRARSDGDFEIVFGHRRHKACKELGLELLATLVDLNDRGLWEEMERENRSRADLSPFEQGCQYKVALAEGLYPSTRKLAEAIGVDVSQAAKVIRIANLPKDVISAFASPNDIQVNWAGDLEAAYKRDPAGIAARAKRVQESAGARPKPKAIFATLVDTGGVEPFHTQKLVIRNAARQELATINRTQAGYSIEIKANDLKVADIESALRKLLGA